MRLSMGWSFLAAMACSLLGCATEDVAEPNLQETGDELNFVLPHCNILYESEQRVNVGQGVKLNVVSKHSIRSLSAWPRRAILMLPPTLATNNIYNANIPGDPSYNALERAAKAGYYAYSLDYEGYGKSTKPAHGGTVTAERMLAQAGKVVEWIRTNSLADKVDVVGMSIGSNIAAALGGTASPTKRSYIGKVVLASNVYKSVTPFFEQMFFTPEFRAFLESAPNGYITTDAAAYGPLFAQASPPAFTWATVNLPGTYATGPTLEGFDLPVFDATRARAEALQVWGDADPVTPLADVADFQADYGGPISLHVIPDGGHSLLLEDGRNDLWSHAFQFLDQGRPSIPTLGCPAP